MALKFPHEETIIENQICEYLSQIKLIREMLKINSYIEFLDGIKCITKRKVLQLYILGLHFIQIIKL